MCVWCRVGGVGARSRKRGGLCYILVRKHAPIEMLGLHFKLTAHLHLVLW